MRKLTLVLKVLSLMIVATGLFAGSAAAAQSNTFPEVINLPNGFQPEGIAVGHGTNFYVGSLANGAIYSGDLRTGEGAVLAEGQEGRVVVGLSFDNRTNYIFAAGGPTGEAHVFDAATGDLLQTYQLTDAETFVNDVVVTNDAAYFTDSSRAVLYRLPLDKGGKLPDQSDIQEIELGGDFELVSGQFNANGIDATPNGKTLVIVNSYLGTLYQVDPTTGNATQIDLGGETVTNGDGILLDGKTLYVVRNQLNQIAVIALNSNLTAGEVVDTITDSDFNVPTTIAEFGKYLYAVNARFGQTPPEELEYQVVQVPKH